MYRRENTSLKIIHADQPTLFVLIKSKRISDGVLQCFTVSTAVYISSRSIKLLIAAVCLQRIACSVDFSFALVPILFTLAQSRRVEGEEKKMLARS